LADRIGAGKLAKQVRRRRKFLDLVDADVVGGKTVGCHALEKFVWQGTERHAVILPSERHGDAGAAGYAALPCTKVRNDSSFTVIRSDFVRFLRVGDKLRLLLLPCREGRFRKAPAIVT
jgi:hypothetical protein